MQRLFKKVAKSSSLVASAVLAVLVFMMWLHGEMQSVGQKVDITESNVLADVLIVLCFGMLAFLAGRDSSKP